LALTGPPMSLFITPDRAVGNTTTGDISLTVGSDSKHGNVELSLGAALSVQVPHFNVPERQQREATATPTHEPGFRLLRQKQPDATASIQVHHFPVPRQAQAQPYATALTHVNQVTCSAEGTAVTEPITTLMIRNLPRSVTRADFIAELDRYAPCMYNFCHMPRCFESGENIGFAFVHLISYTAARHLVSAWHRQRLFGIGAKEPALNLSPAA